MPPNISSAETKILTENDFQKDESSATQKENECFATQSRSKIYTKTESWFKTELKWFNIIFISFFHLYFIYGCLTFNFFENWKTTAWLLFMYQFGGFGITGGAHRLWSHRSYKAKWPLRIILLVSYCAGGLNSPYDWVRDHYLHHKYVDTDADPHNSSRGFFFSHVGWLMMKKHPEVIQKGRLVNMSNVLTDPIFVFGTKHINPTENRFVSCVAGGEGWHNYHHVFPWDYKASELIYSHYSTTVLINFFAKIGWAYDLKEASHEFVKTIAINMVTEVIICGVLCRI